MISNDAKAGLELVKNPTVPLISVVIPCRNDERDRWEKLISHRPGGAHA